jgi:hypothetical protein
LPKFLCSNFKQREREREREGEREIEIERERERERQREREITLNDFFMKLSLTAGFLTI